MDNAKIIEKIWENFFDRVQFPVHGSQQNWRIGKEVASFLSKKERATSVGIFAEKGSWTADGLIMVVPDPKAFGGLRLVGGHTFRNLERWKGMTSAEAAEILRRGLSNRHASGTKVPVCWNAQQVACGDIDWKKVEEVGEEARWEESYLDLNDVEVGQTILYHNSPQSVLWATKKDGAHWDVFEVDNLKDIEGSRGCSFQEMVWNMNSAIKPALEQVS